ncbi:DUF5082 family protein [Peribacillus sp. NPDC096447]|uniref:YwqH-like family protein n=1 Tax=Peribacillus sp. NPDC096447 TaxID=3364394 RepID=UPI00381A5A37
MSYGLISYYSSMIAKKEEEIRRLQEAKGKLAGCQDELAQYRNLFFEPELTADSWNGQLAKDFETERQTLQATYQELKDEQFQDSLNAIDSKISQMQAEIAQLRSMFASI